MTGWNRGRSGDTWNLSVVSDSLQPHGLYSLLGFSIHGIFQARVLEWVAISFSPSLSKQTDSQQPSQWSVRWACVPDAPTWAGELPPLPKASGDWQPGEGPPWLAWPGVWRCGCQESPWRPTRGWCQAELVPSRCWAWRAHPPWVMALKGACPTLGGEGEGCSPPFRGQFRQRTRTGQEGGEGSLVGAGLATWVGGWRPGDGAGPCPIGPIPAAPPPRGAGHGPSLGLSHHCGPASRSAGPGNQHRQ